MYAVTKAGIGCTVCGYVTDYIYIKTKKPPSLRKAAFVVLSYNSFIPQPSSRAIAHSERRPFTGFAVADLIVRKLIVKSAINSAPAPASINTHKLRLV